MMNETLPLSLPSPFPSWTRKPRFAGFRRMNPHTKDPHIKNVRLNFWETPPVTNEAK